jgi:hypothetical protein
MGAGIFLLSRMSANTSYGHAVGNIVLMGIGLGVTFPVYTIVVQNTVPHRVLGVATSSIQFFRSIGGTIGLAVLGSVMTSRFAAALTGTLPAGVEAIIPPEKLAGLADNPQALLSPNARTQLQAGFEAAGPQAAGLFDQFLGVLRQALAGAIGDIFLVGFVVIVAAWIATLFLKGAPPRRDSRPEGETGPGLPQSESAGNG